MDPAVQRALNDKLYDKRKVGALECVTFRLAYQLRTLLRYLILLGWRGSFVNSSPKRTTLGSRLCLTSSATILLMPSTNPMPETEV